MLWFGILPEVRRILTFVNKKLDVTKLVSRDIVKYGDYSVLILLMFDHSQSSLLLKSKNCERPWIDAMEDFLCKILR